MKAIVTGTAALSLMILLSACGSDAPKDDTRDTPSPSPAAPSPTTPPAFDESDYTYVLRLICRCPFTAPVEITVENDQVTSAVVHRGTNTVAKGDPAPEALHLTISDILAEAESLPAARSQVDWPDGQAWPDRVRIELVPGARDADITYVISNVTLD